MGSVPLFFLLFFRRNLVEIVRHGEGIVLPLEKEGREAFCNRVNPSSEVCLLGEEPAEKG